MLKTLRDERAKLVADMRAILNAAEKESRDLSADEIASYDAMKAQRDALNTRIARLEGQDEMEGALDAVIPAVSRRGGVEPPRRGAEARTAFENLGEFMHAVRFRPNDQRLNYVEEAGANLTDDMRSEQRMDDGPSGGFAIPPQFRDTLLKLTPQQAIVRPRAQVIPAGDPPDSAITMPALDQTGSAPANIFGGVQVQWTAEGGTKQDTSAKLREITLTPHEVSGTITVTDKLLRNWGAASALLEQQLRGAVAQSEDFAFLKGNGVGKPLGVLGAGALMKVARNTANTVKWVDIVAMVTKLYGNGTFFYSRSMLASLMNMVDSQGRPLWVNSFREGEPSTLAGLPAILNERNPTLGSLGDLWAADLSQYLIKDGSGPFVAASEHVYFQQNKTMIKIFWNVDGTPWLTAPFQNEGGETVSPFVALDVPGS